VGRYVRLEFLCLTTIFETICINYSTGRKQNNWKNTSAINLNMYLYFQYLLYVVFGSLHVAAGWFGLMIEIFWECFPFDLFTIYFLLCSFFMLLD
jgi:hypothetical protein